MTRKATSGWTKEDDDEADFYEAVTPLHQEWQRATGKPAQADEGPAKGEVPAHSPVTADTRHLSVWGKIKWAFKSLF